MYARGFKYWKREAINNASIDREDLDIKSPLVVILQLDEPSSPYERELKY